MRPLVGDEQPHNADPSLLCDVEESAVVIGKDKQFQFDYVFDQEANQVGFGLSYDVILPQNRSKTLIKKHLLVETKFSIKLFFAYVYHNYVFHVSRKNIAKYHRNRHENIYT